MLNQNPLKCISESPTSIWKPVSDFAFSDTFVFVSTAGRFGCLVSVWVDSGL